MEKYSKLEKLGEGAHGVVTKARVRSVDEIRAARKAAAASSEPQIDIGAQPGAAFAAAASSTATPASSSSSVTGNTPKKRKHEDDTTASSSSSAPMDDSDEVEILDPISLPAPADTIVAIKKIRLRDAKEGLSMEAIREIKLLQELSHPNVLKLLDIFSHHSNINLVLEYMTGDLEGLIRSRAKAQQPLSAGDIKAYMKMILQGMQHCHERWILHRDMKPGNLLLGTDGSIKLADFGLAKIYGSPDRRMSPQACTVWYRAPELVS